MEAISKSPIPQLPTFTPLANLPPAHAQPACHQRHNSRSIQRHPRQPVPQFPQLGFGFAPKLGHPLRVHPFRLRFGRWQANPIRQGGGAAQLPHKLTAHKRHGRGRRRRDRAAVS